MHNQQIVERPQNRSNYIRARLYPVALVEVVIAHLCSGHPLRTNPVIPRRAGLFAKRIILRSREPALRCDRQDLALHATMSHGVATVRQPSGGAEGTAQACANALQQQFFAVTLAASIICAMILRPPQFGGRLPVCSQGASTRKIRRNYRISCIEFAKYSWHIQCCYKDDRGTNLKLR